MGQAEFHRRYEAYHGDIKFELVGGFVHMSSPLRIKHSDYDGELGFVLGLYRRATPGIGELHNATAILGDESEPQPDLGLRILEEYGGQSTVNSKDYIVGPPELLAEIAYSTRSIDLHLKRVDYRFAGVQEYLVLCVEEQELHWFDFKSRRPIRPTSKGVYRSRAFPGLWIDGAALMALKSQQVEDVARQGLATKDHAAFVEELARRV
jgi:Uma2 family endonuclease